MVAVYVSLFKKGLRTLAQIPLTYRVAVVAALESEGYIF